MKISYLLLVIPVLIFSCDKDKSEEITITKQDNSQIQKFAEEDPDTELQKEEVPVDIDESDKIISTNEVNNYIKKTVTVEGYVADVVMRPKVNYLNFDNKFPKHTFTVVIFPKDAENFEDLNIFKNKNIQVKGKIELYRGKPQIIVNSTEQIKIVK